MRVSREQGGGSRRTHNATQRHNRTLFASSDACICSRASDMIARPLMARWSSCTLSPITASKVLYLASGTWHKPHESTNGCWLNPHGNLHGGH